MLYWVKVNGEAVNVKFEEGDQLCGFYKNEFVLAADEASAAEIAKRDVRDALRNKKGVRREDIEKATLKAEKVGPTLRLWRLWFPSGFVFYPIE